MRESSRYEKLKISTAVKFLEGSFKVLRLYPIAYSLLDLVNEKKTFFVTLMHG